MCNRSFFGSSHIRFSAHFQISQNNMEQVHSRRTISKCCFEHSSNCFAPPARAGPAPPEGAGPGYSNQAGTFSVKRSKACELEAPLAKSVTRVVEVAPGHAMAHELYEADNSASNLQRNTRTCFKTDLRGRQQEIVQIWYECNICSSAGGFHVSAVEPHLLSKKHKKRLEYLKSLESQNGSGEEARKRIAEKEKLQQKWKCNIEQELKQHGYKPRPPGKWIVPGDFDAQPQTARRLRLLLRNQKIVKSNVKHYDEDVHASDIL